MDRNTEKLNGRDLGAAVMHYLGQFRVNRSPDTSSDEPTKLRNYDRALFRFVTKKTDSDTAVVDTQQSGNVEDVKISNLLSDMTKKAAQSEPKPTILTKPLYQLQDSIRHITKNPLYLGLALAVPSGLLGWGLSKYFGEPDPADAKEYKEYSERLHADTKDEMNKRIADLGIQPAKLDPQRRRKIIEESLAKVKSRYGRSHMWKGLGVGLGVLALNSALHYDNRGLKSLVSYLPKNASMLGPSPELPTEMVKDAVLHNDGLDPWTKLQTISMLQNAPEPTVSSTDIINTAVSTGASAIANKPLGRIAVSAAADYVLGRGIGSLLGMSNPNTLGAILSIGTLVNNLAK